MPQFCDAACRVVRYDRYWLDSFPQTIGNSYNSNLTESPPFADFIIGSSAFPSAASGHGRGIREPRGGGVGPQRRKAARD
jgi:hypothetical protein